MSYDVVVHILCPSSTTVILFHVDVCPDSMLTNIHIVYYEMRELFNVCPHLHLSCEYVLLIVWNFVVQIEICPAVQIHQGVSIKGSYNFHN